MTRVAMDDTIVAIATPPGRGALAIVRLSGRQAFEIARPLVRHWPMAARTATLTPILDRDGSVIDQAVVVTYRAPASFTGEDAVEITSHGGPIAPAGIMAALVSTGARVAEPGEFTRRAVLNGKLDLLQAEAVGDLVDADSRAAHRVALAQLDGGLSRRIAALRDDILGLEALSAYDIDFPEEDDGPVPAARIIARTRDVVADVERLLATASVGEIVRDGAVVVVAGAPNVGKSSLFNALLGRRRAIVTDIPGTTRDALEAVVEAGGWPIRLVDTAGLRDASDTIEQLGIEVSREYLDRADLVLVCGDSADSLRAAERAVADASRAPTIEVRTKSDIVRADEPARRNGVQWVSAATGEGLRELSAAIAARLEKTKGILALDAPLVTRERHRVALTHACNELRAFLTAWEQQSLPAVVAAVHLRDATRHLEELIGTVDVDDVLDRIFSSFCVGK
ncbi:MAG TPA: tRNA uridine-5-carboxymethylaminomethyl(34) synthesis GTPase MnmE [Gemmatimonadaceae bacterium]|nr:tRNA uridine-5-carboxymethylaminomethyl(34) synthesis GTPase MnmE [Gemmatimonadaceae bacterium]